MIMVLFAVLVLGAMAISMADVGFQLVLFLLTTPPLLFMVFCRWSTPKPRNMLFVLMTLATMNIALSTGSAIVGGDTLLAVLLGFFTLAWSYATLGVASKLTSLRDNRPHILSPQK